MWGREDYQRTRLLTSGLLVVGTANVLEGDRRREEEQQASARDASLKYDRTGKILLVPQPSDDPNDPLVCASTYL